MLDYLTKSWENKKMTNQYENLRDISVKVNELEYHLIESASNNSGLSLEGYVHRAIMLQTELNPEFQHVIVLSDDDFSRISEELEKPPKLNNELNRRLNQKAPWEN